MKNLIEELHTLNEKEFEVSASFSKNVMKKIKRKNNIVAFARIASVLSCACLAVAFIFVANQHGLFNFSNNTASNANAVKTIPEFSSAGNIDNSYESSITYDAVEKSVVEEKRNSKFEAPIIDLAPSSSVYEESINSTSDDVSRTYSKQYFKEDYLHEISNLLNDNNIANEISDEKIIIESNDINRIYDLLEKYIDIELEFNEDKIILSIK